MCVTVDATPQHQNNHTARDRAAWRFSCSEVASRKKLNARAALRARDTPRGVGVEDDDEDGWETVSSDEEAPPTEAIS